MEITPSLSWTTRVVNIRTVEKAAIFLEGTQRKARTSELEVPEARS
jgi:hypothetical protein